MLKRIRIYVVGLFVLFCLTLCSAEAGTLNLLPAITIAAAGKCPQTDISGDCRVDMDDLVMFAEYWLDPAGSLADFAGNDGVNTSDFAMLAQNWLVEKSPIIINEIHYNPDLAQELVEFVELYNMSTSAVDISGWQFTNGITYTFPAGTTIAAGGYLVAAEDPTPAYVDVTITGKYGTSASLVKGPFTGSLSNEGETITLSDALGNTVDKVEYQLGFPWPTVGDAVPDTSLGSGHSIQLVNPAFDNDLGGNWRSAYPTPGAANTEIYAANNPPCIRQVEHTPKQPTAGQVVTITAKVTDTDGISSVILKYQINNPGGYIPVTLPVSGGTTSNSAFENSANWTSVAMHDDGLNGDIEADDGIFTAQLSAAVQTHRRLIRYRITAADAGARSITVPYADDPQSNFAYFVYNGVPSWTADGVTYSSADMSSLPVFQVISRGTDITTCHQGVDTNIYQYAATVIYDGDVYDHVYYRIKGEYSPNIEGKKKWKFNFNRGHCLKMRDDYGQRYEQEWDKINLSTGTCPYWQEYGWDSGVDGMILNEAATFRFFNLAGVPGCNTTFLHVRVIDDASENGTTQYNGDFWALYIGVEDVDSRYLKQHDLPDGNLYKMAGSPSGANQGATEPDITSASDVNAFVSAYNSHPAQSWWESTVNMDSYYRYRTVCIAVNNSDARPSWNCFYYHNPITNKWQILPWDVDLVYEYATHYSDNEHFRYSIEDHSQLNLEYKNRARELQDLLFNGQQANQVLDEMAAVVDNASAAYKFHAANRSRWEYDPYVVSRGRSGLFYRSVRFSNFAGVVEHMKTFISPAGYGSAYGGGKLTADIADASIPDTPTITYIGTSGYPENDLRFQTNAYNGTNSFAAYQWRIARVDDPNAAGYVVRQRHHYEVQTKWQSPDITDFGDRDIQIPADQVEVAGTYRVRCRFKDATGRCGHWSAPIQFTTTGGVVTDLLQNLRITELMYNPAEPGTAEIAAGCTDNDDFEFIELMNTGTTTLDLTDTYFSDGIVYSFGGAVTGASLLSTEFDSSADGFTYADDTFGTNNPNYAIGTYEAAGGQTGGGLYVYLGTKTSNEMSGSWSRSFTLSADATVMISVSYRMIAGSGLDSDEHGESILSIDSTRYGSAANNALVYITGDGSGGIDDDSGWQTYTANIGLSAGTHIINLGGYCNKADSDKGTEWVKVYFDNISIMTVTTSTYTLAPGAYALIVKNQAAFETRYGTGLSSLIAGQYTGSLNNAGETIRLTDAWDGNVFKFSYNDGYGWPVSADGPGHSLVPIDSAVAGQHDGTLEYGGNWRASTYIKGSPGVADPAPISSIMINEVMAHTDYDNSAYPDYDSNDWIELYNPTGAGITYNSNWYLSDNPDNLRKWALPSGTIAAGGRFVFDEVTGFHSPVGSGFGLDKTGEYVILSYLPGNSNDRVVDYVRFSGQYNTISWGRLSDGGAWWYFLANPGTRGTANTSPVQKKVVISEIMYHPEEGTTEEEYIELYNPTGLAANLYNADGTWRLDNAVTYVFSANVSIPAYGKIVVVPFDPVVDTDQLAAFNAAYGCSLVAGSTVFGPWTGDLSNSGERLALQEPQEADPPTVTTVWWINADQVIYADCSPWVTSPDGTGTALIRSSSAAAASGDNPANWTAAAPSPGY